MIIDALSLMQWTNKCKQVAAMMIIVVATCLFFSCSDDSEEPEPEPDSTMAESRTLMMYIVAENSLAGQLNGDISELLQGMKAASLYKNDKMVVYVDDTQLPRIYVIDRHTKATTLSELEPSVSYTEDVNSCSAEQLGAFIDYAKQHVPADSYGLVMWSHASGWVPSDYAGDQVDVATKIARRRTFGLDNGKNSSKSFNGSQMEVADMARVLEEKGGVDFIFFDACFMQAIEVAYELRRSARHIFGSPAEIPGPGADYQTMVPSMFKKDYVESMLTAYYNAYENNPTYGLIFSAIETDVLPAFADYMRTVVANDGEKLTWVDRNKAITYFDYVAWGLKTNNPDYPDILDMQSVMKQILTDDAFEDWKQEVEGLVMCKHLSYWYSTYTSRNIPFDSSLCCGVSMYIPDYGNRRGYERYNEPFFQTEWAKAVWLHEE